jgi:hypothetical protein
MGKVVQFKVTERKALDFVRACAADSSKVFVDPHALKRMKQRKLTYEQVIRCLLKGIVTEGPYQHNRSGKWRLNLTRVVAGDHVTVVAEMDFTSDVLVVTVF